MLPSLGGQGQLGHARGSIDIDTRGLQRAQQEARRVGRDIQRSLGDTIGSAAQRAGRGLGSIADDIRSIRGELLAIGAASGVLTALGLSGARSMRAFRVQFRQFTGTEAEAVALMEDLTETANRFGLEVEGVFTFSRSLLPILEGNTEELDKWVQRAGMLRSVFPTAQRGAETRALSEFLAGQTMSLQRLFNVPPSLIQEAQDATNDLGEQLDFILERMGATEAAALQQADAFVAVRNSIQLALSTGFTPLFEELQPIAAGFAEWLNTLRQTHPELLAIGSGAIAVAAVGAPLLVFLGQVISSLERIRQLSIAGSLGRAGAAGLAVAGGVGLGLAGTRAIGRATGNETLSEAGGGTLLTVLRQMVVGATNTILTMANIISVLFREVAHHFARSVGQMISAMGRFVQRVGELVPDFAGGGRLRDIGEGMEGFGAEVIAQADETEAGMGDWISRIDKRREEWVLAVARFVGAIDDAADETEAAAAGGVTGGPAGPRFSDEFTDIAVEFNDALTAVQEEANRAREEEERAHGERRNRIVADYNRTLEREEEDFQRQRQRQNDQLEDDIIETEQERDERIADLRDKSNERITELEEDKNRRLEELQEDHQRNLIEAAARLDASAVALEQMRFRDRRDDIEEDYDRRIEQERENLQERIDAANEAAAERIADLREHHAERQRLEDEDRAIRLQRMQEDHQRQLTELDAQHQRRLTQISQNAVAERQELEAAFQERLAELGIHNAAWLELQQQREADSLEMFGDYLDTWNRMARERLLAQDPESDPFPGGYQHGGPVSRTGRALVHAGEFVLNRDTTQALAAMMGNRFSQAGLLGAVAGGGGSRHLSISPNAFNFSIQAAPGMSPGDIGDEVESRVYRVIEDLLSEFAE